MKGCYRLWIQPLAAISGHGQATAVGQKQTLLT